MYVKTRFFTRDGSVLTQILHRDRYVPTKILHRDGSVPTQILHRDGSVPTQILHRDGSVLTQILHSLSQRQARAQIIYLHMIHSSRSWSSCSATRVCYPLRCRSPGGPIHCHRERGPGSDRFTRNKTNTADVLDYSAGSPTKKLIEARYDCCTVTHFGGKKKLECRASLTQDRRKMPLFFLFTTRTTSFISIHSRPWDGSLGCPFTFFWIKATYK